MQIAFIADPLASFKIYKDSTYAMMVEAAARLHELWFIEPHQLEREPSGVIRAHAARLHLTGDAQDWYRTEPPAWRAVSGFDAVVMRKDPPFDMEYVYATYLLELAEQQGARVFNRPRAIRDHNEKLAIAGFPEFMVPTLVTRDAKRLRDFHAEYRDIILKPLDGMGGTGVFRVREDELNLGAIIESVSLMGARSVMAQRYIPEIQEGDKRILLIGGQVVPYCLARIPQGKEIRGNLAQGGVGRAQSLSPRDLEIAQTLAPVLSERGLLLVGIDVIGDYLTEVNVTSPTCFQEITQQSGFPVAALFVDALEAALR
jgi:glutathione synthase